MQKFKKFIPVGLMFTPSLAFAVSNFNELAATIAGMLNVVIGLLVAVAIVIFLYGVVKYVVSGGDAEKKDAARNTIIYGVIGLFVMVSVWGLVALLANTFGLENSPISPPVVPDF